MQKNSTLLRNKLFLLNSSYILARSFEKSNITFTKQFQHQQSELSIKDPSTCDYVKSVEKILSVPNIHECNEDCCWSFSIPICIAKLILFKSFSAFSSSTQAKNYAKEQTQTPRRCVYK